MSMTTEEKHHEVECIGIQTSALAVPVVGSNRRCARAAAGELGSRRRTLPRLVLTGGLPR
jgi:hypothetical protein